MAMIYLKEILILDHILTPLLLSLKIATFATLIAFFIGIVFAWWFALHKNKLTSLLSIIITVPLILPPTVLGYYLLVLFSRNSILGQWLDWLGIPIIFTARGAIIAAAIAALPLLIRPIQAAFEGIDRETIKAAELDGATRLQVLTYIIAPLSYKGILAGTVLGFARAMGEFGATLMIAGNIPGRTQTLSIAIYDAVQANRMTDAHLMVIILTLTTFLILFMLHFVLGRSDK